MKEKTKRVTIELPFDLFKKIEDQAKANERDLSKEIRFMVKKYFEGERR